MIPSAWALATVISGMIGLNAAAQEKNQEKPAVGVVAPAAPVLAPMGAIALRGGPILANSGIVKDAPFSGETVIENIQVLADGNRIVNRSSTMIYRDSQGRTRNEYSFKFPAQPGGESQEHKTISIYDPVENVSYTLDPQNRTAHKAPHMAPLSMMAAEARKSETKAARSSDPSTGAPAVNQGSPVVRATATNRLIAAPGLMMGTAVGSIRPLPAAMPGTSESLGKQMIEGVEAEGIRTVQSIPAGTMGNERPIEITFERWYSPELQMDVMTKSNDPRWGESTMRLINISRSEPDSSLFQIPSDYTVQEPMPYPMQEAGDTKFLQKIRKPNQQ